MRYLLAFLAVSACSGDPGTVDISAEPSPIAAHAEPIDRVPLTHEIPGPPVEVLEAPPEPDAPPVVNGECLPGFHDAFACCLPDVLPAGSCKCTEYDAAGKIIVLGEQCFDSCKYNRDGIAEVRSFCVVGGLVADRILK